MTTVRVKICGLTRDEDVLHAVRAGADALGFVFAPGSKRLLQVEQARRLVMKVPAFVARVGLFLDQEAAEVEHILDRVPLNLLQFHGNEQPDYCRRFSRPYIKAVSMKSADALRAAEKAFGDASGLLLDSHAPGGLGGTGTVFDWSRVQQRGLPIILAGGLTPANVAEAVRTVRPWAVDVSSGVESAPGIKQHELIDIFITEAKREH